MKLFMILKDLGMKIGLNTMKNTNNDTIKLAKIRIARCDKAHPDNLFQKTS